jgi:hypothetical protein
MTKTQKLRLLVMIPNKQFIQVIRRCVKRLLNFEVLYLLSLILLAMLVTSL